MNTMSPQEHISAIYEHLAALQRAMEVDTIVSTKQAAYILGCSLNTIYRLIRSGRLKKIVRGNAAGISRKEILGLKKSP